MQNAAATVAEYLEQLPEDRKAAISKVRAVIRKNPPKRLRRNHAVRHDQLCDSAQALPERLPLRSQTAAAVRGLGFAEASHGSLSHACFRGDGGAERGLHDGFAAAGKKLDMGKSCIRFRKLDDLPLDVIGEAIAKVSPANSIMTYEDQLRLSKSRKKS